IRKWPCRTFAQELSQTKYSAFSRRWRATKTTFVKYSDIPPYLRKGIAIVTRFNARSVGGGVGRLGCRSPKRSAGELRAAARAHPPREIRATDSIMGDIASRACRAVLRSPSNAPRRSHGIQGLAAGRDSC